MVDNPSRPDPVNLQVFIVPVAVRVDSAAGGVSAASVRKGVAPALDRLLEQTLPDQLDRDPEDQMPFAFHGAEALWDIADELAGKGPSVIVAAWLTAPEVELLRFALANVRHGLDCAGRLFPERLVDYTVEGVDSIVRKFGFDRPAGENPPSAPS